jgi:heme-binding protein
MSRRLKQAAIAFVVVFAAAQLVRPSRANPPTDPGLAIQTHEQAKGLAAVLDRSCGDCHSNATARGWYTEVAPLSWLMASTVAKGRSVVNFSEWMSYPPEQQQILLSLSCQDASGNKMPGPYVWFRSETRLSAEDVATICAAARQADARAGGVAR